VADGVRRTFGKAVEDPTYLALMHPANFPLPLKRTRPVSPKKRANSGARQEPQKQSPQRRHKLRNSPWSTNSTPSVKQLQMSLRSDCAECGFYENSSKRVKSVLQSAVPRSLCWGRIFLCVAAVFARVFG